MGRKNLANQDYVTMESIAGYCMVSTGTVRRWIKSGELRASQLPSGQYRVSLADLKNFLKQNNIELDTK
jgi:excisionase family DNA binding protein